MDPAELVRLIDILNPENRAGRITIITRMGPENMRVKLPHLIRAVRGAGQIVTWVTDPMHGNTMKAPCGLKTRSFDRILVILLLSILFQYWFLQFYLSWYCSLLPPLCILLSQLRVIISLWEFGARLPMQCSYEKKIIAYVVYRFEFTRYRQYSFTDWLFRSLE